MKLLYIGKFPVSFAKQSETKEMSIINVLPRKQGVSKVYFEYYMYNTQKVSELQRWGTPQSGVIETPRIHPSSKFLLFFLYLHTSIPLSIVHSVS